MKYRDMKDMKANLPSAWAKRARIEIDPETKQAVIYTRLFQHPDGSLHEERFEDASVRE